MAFGVAESEVCGAATQPPPERLVPALLEQHPEHLHAAMSAGRLARSSLPDTKTLLFLTSPAERALSVDKHCPMSDSILIILLFMGDH